VPTPAEQAKSRKLFKEVFAADLSDHSPAARHALAAKLLEQSVGVHDVPADQFVLLVGAIQAGKEASDLDLCCRAADAMAVAYQVDGLGLKYDTVMKMTLRAGTLAATTDNVRAGLNLVDELAKVENYTSALKVLQMLRTTVPDAALNAEIQARVKQVETLRVAADRVAPYLQKRFIRRKRR